MDSRQSNRANIMKLIAVFALCAFALASTAIATLNKQPVLKLSQAPQSTPDQDDAMSCLRECIQTFNACNEKCLSLWADDAYSACHNPCLKEHGACRTECRKPD